MRQYNSVSSSELKNLSLLVVELLCLPDPLQVCLWHHRHHNHHQHHRHHLYHNYRQAILPPRTFYHLSSSSQLRSYSWQNERLKFVTEGSRDLGIDGLLDLVQSNQTSGSFIDVDCSKHSGDFFLIFMLCKVTRPRVSVVLIFPISGAKMLCNLKQVNGRTLVRAENKNECLCNADVGLNFSQHESNSMCELRRYYTVL